MNFIESFLHINDESVISELENLIKLKDKNEDLKPMSLESFYEMIDLSLAQAEAGEVHTSEEIDALIDTWK